MASDVNRKGAAVDGDDAVSEVMAQLAEAEAAEAQARAEAARAKATAARLRGGSETDDADTDTEADAATDAEPGRPWWSRLPWPKIAAGLVVLGICALLALGGLMVWQHQRVEAQRAHRAAIVTAAKDGVTALLSIDYTHAKADVQRVIDLSTGSFKDDFTKGADDFVKTAEQSKAVTVGSINAAALEGETRDSGVVLLAAASQVTNANGAKQDPRAWRMSVTVTRDGDKLKMSDVEFVP